MEESKKITLPLGDASLNPNLGIYYIDMRPAEVHYTHNIWHGAFDSKGVPMCGDGSSNYFYFPINIAQYGFILHAKYLTHPEVELLERMKACLAKLDELATRKGNHTVWYHEHYEAKYKIPPPWASAMAQGELISFYLRMYQQFEDQKYLDTANQAYEFLKIDSHDGGVRCIDAEGDLWFEEYPSDPPSFVLNGFVYTLLGLYDLLRVTGRDDVKSDIQASIVTLKKNLHRFDTGYWSRYDLLKKELVRYYYQKNVHVPQMAILFQLTGDPIFELYRKRWSRYVNPFNYLFVQIMYRIQWRWQTVKKWFA